MTIPEIIEQLKPYTGEFPMAAVKAAIEQQEAITPELLREFEEMAVRGEETARRKDFMLPVFAAYLLAQFREKRAHFPLVSRALFDTRKYKTISSRGIWSDLSSTIKVSKADERTNSFTLSHW